jgi:hypothetical protein
MLFTVEDTRDYFSRLDLTLVHRAAPGKPASPDVWSLTFGRDRAFRIHRQTAFDDLDDLWLAWYCIQPVLEDSYAFARMLAEQAVDWSADERRQMDRWIYAHLSCYGLRALSWCQWSPPTVWPWTLMRARTSRDVLLRPRGCWWPHAVARPHRASAVSQDALAAAGWRERGLQVGRFDQQCAARFASAFAGLIDIAEPLALDTRIAKADESVPVVVVRKRL